MTPIAPRAKSFDADESLEFDYFLASKLDMLVTDLRSRMPNTEYVGWRMYFARKAQREELEMLKAKASGN